MITCRTAEEARAAIIAAMKILKELGVELHPQKTRVVHVWQGFEFLGYKIKRGKQLRLPPSKIRTQALARVGFMRIRERSRSAALWIRCVSGPSDASRFALGS